MNVVADDAGDKIVVFNGSNILVLDQNMNTIATYMSTEKETRPSEPLSLSLDKSAALPGAQVAISGTGFGLNETLKIEFNKVLVAEVQADESGSFDTTITTPTLTVIGPLNTDIKVTGKTSGLTYSTSFRIQ